MNIIPIPHNLKLCLNLNANKSNKNSVVGMIKCMCGCEEFSIQYFGDLTKHFISNCVLMPCLYDNKHIIHMNAICQKCKKEYTIFNNQTDGYDALIENKTHTNLYSMKNFMCQKCNKDVFNIFVKLEYLDKQDIIENIGENSEWENAFSWIDIDLICRSCCKKYYGLIDYEAS